MMLKTTAIVALAIQMFGRTSAMEVPAYTAAACVQNAPSDVQNPAGAIIAGATCYECAGDAITRFDIGGDAGEMGEDSVGCYCSDGSACVSWAAVSTEEVNPDCFPYDDADDCEEGDWGEFPIEME